MSCPAVDSNSSTDVLTQQCRYSKGNLFTQPVAELPYHTTAGRLDQSQEFTFAQLPIGIASERESLSPFFTVPERKTFMAFPVYLMLLLLWSVTLML